MSKKIIVSGMRPTGRIHLGNYAGVIKNWIKLQNEYECFFFIADIHALTTDINNIEKINFYKKKIITEWLASGLKPEKCNFFIQSHIPEIFELYTILSMITPLSLAERVPTYKSYNKEHTYGFLGYPILQGADILILNADYVPVGEDQLPHLELIREITRKINNLIKKNSHSKENFFKEPQSLLNNNKNLLGLDGTKMSKSKNNTILISEEPDILIKKIRKIQIDLNRININIPGNPSNCNVWDFHKVFSNKKECEKIINDCTTAQIGCLDCKNILFNNINKKNEKIIQNIKMYEKNDSYINDIIKAGDDKVKNIASFTLRELKKHLNLN